MPEFVKSTRLCKLSNNCVVFVDVVDNDAKVGRFDIGIAVVAANAVDNVDIVDNADSCGNVVELGKFALLIGVFEIGDVVNSVFVDSGFLESCNFVAVNDVDNTGIIGNVDSG